MAMEIKSLTTNDAEDFKSLIEIFVDVFEHDIEIPPLSYLTKLLQQDNFIVLVSKIEGKVVGGLTIYSLAQYYSTKPLAYIYDVGVTPLLQGKGIGKALIQEACRICKELGYEEAYVEAETEDIDAVEFYRRTKYNSEMSATHFSYEL